MPEKTRIQFIRERLKAITLIDRSPGRISSESSGYDVSIFQRGEEGQFDDPHNALFVSWSVDDIEYLLGLTDQLTRDKELLTKQIALLRKMITE